MPDLSLGQRLALPYESDDTSLADRAGLVLGSHKVPALEPVARRGGAGAGWQAAAPISPAPAPGDAVARPNPGAELLTQFEYRYEA